TPTPCRPAASTWSGAVVTPGSFATASNSAACWAGFRYVWASRSPAVMKACSSRWFWPLLLAYSQCSIASGSVGRATREAGAGGQVARGGGAGVPGLGVPAADVHLAVVAAGQRVLLGRATGLRSAAYQTVAGTVDRGPDLVPPGRLLLGLEAAIGLLGGADHD